MVKKKFRSRKQVINPHVWIFFLHHTYKTPEVADWSMRLFSPDKTSGQQNERINWLTRVIRGVRERKKKSEGLPMILYSRGRQWIRSRGIATIYGTGAFFLFRGSRYAAAHPSLRECWAGGRIYWGCFLFFLFLSEKLENLVLFYGWAARVIFGSINISLRALEVF